MGELLEEAAARRALVVTQILNDMRQLFAAERARVRGQCLAEGMPQAEVAQITAYAGQMHAEQIARAERLLQGHMDSIAALDERTLTVIGGTASIH